MRLNFSTMVAAIIVSGVASFAPTPISAAPQILGLVATVAPVPLTCIAGKCAAEISSVCLQRHRPVPEPNTAYVPARNTLISLIVTGPDGVQRSVPIADKVEIKSARGFTSVSVSVAENVVRHHGITTEGAALSIAPMASAVPVARIGDTDPLGDSEVRKITGALRSVAENTFLREPATMTAGGFLNQMINRLPPDQPVGAERIKPMREQLGRQIRAVGNSHAERLLGRAFKSFRHKLRHDRTPGLRTCLGNQHDILMSDATLKIWQALKPGG